MKKNPNKVSNEEFANLSMKVLDFLSDEFLKARPDLGPIDQEDKLDVILDDDELTGEFIALLIKEITHLRLKICSMQNDHNVEARGMSMN